MMSESEKKYQKLFVHAAKTNGELMARIVELEKQKCSMYTVNGFPCERMQDMCDACRMM